MASNTKSFGFKIEEHLHEALKIKAAKENVKIGELMNRIVADALKINKGK